MNLEKAIKILDYKINMYEEDVFIGDLDKTNIEAIQVVLKEIERLKEEYMILQNASDEVEEELQQRINKAIEYIEEDIRGNYFKRYDDEVYKMCEDLLDILKGDDKE